MSLIIVFLFSIILDPSFGFGVAVEIEPDFHPIPCMDDKKFYYLDCSQLTVISDHKASKVYVNGTITYLKDVGDGIRLNFTSERFHDGQWISGELKFEWNDFCAMIGDPLKQPVVYRVMQRGFNQKKCTFKAGHTETFNMFSISTVPLGFPPQYMDLWRLYFRYYENDKVMDCWMFEGEIID